MKSQSLLWPRPPQVCIDMPRPRLTGLAVLSPRRCHSASSPSVRQRWATITINLRARPGEFQVAWDKFQRIHIQLRREIVIAVMVMAAACG